MSTFKILVEYTQLFCPTGKCRMSSPGRMDLDGGVENIRSATATLEEIAANVPQKGKMTVGLNNCETELVYETEIRRNGNLREPTEVLTYFLGLPEEHQPRRIHVFTEQYTEQVETFLNQHRKTLMPSKSGEGLGVRIVIGKYGTLVREMKKLRR